MNLIESLKLYRLKHKITQERLAIKLGVSFSTVNRWLGKKVKPSQIQEFQIKKVNQGELAVSYISQNPQSEKHKEFVSYYHKDDQSYREEFTRRFGQKFLDKSVEPGDIPTNVPDEYIKKLIQEDFLSDSSVVVVLIGPKTYCRMHVDWEISAGLNKKVGGYSGLLGILLPEYPVTSEGSYNPDGVPARLADNVKSGFAEIYRWDQVCANEYEIKKAVQDAFDGRISNSAKIKNARIQLTEDLCK